MAVYIKYLFKLIKQYRCIKINYYLSNKVVFENVHLVKFSEIIEYLDDLVADQGYLSKSLQLQRPRMLHSRQLQILAI